MARSVKSPALSGHLTFLTLILVFAVCIDLSQTKNFRFKRPGDQFPCIMVDTFYAIDIIANYNGTIVAVEVLTSDDDDVTVTGDCETNKEHIMKIVYKDSIRFYFVFQPHNEHPVAMYRVLQFVPKSVFGEDVNITEVQNFYDPRPIYIESSKDCYECDVIQSQKYSVYPNSTSDYIFDVHVTTYGVKAQGFGVIKGQFGNPEICPAQPQPSTPIPSHNTTLRPTSAPFPNPKPPVNTYIVKTGNVTCIVLQSAIELIILYPLKGTRNQLKKAVFNIPETASATGNCSAYENTQYLDIKFFNDWSLFIRFEKSPRDKTNQRIGGKNDADLSYRISQMSLTVVVDQKRFPDSKFSPGTKYTVTSKKDDLPQKPAGSSFYRCDSDSVDTLASDVQVKTDHLKFKAFNTDSNVEFQGH